MSDQSFFSIELKIGCTILTSIVSGSPIIQGKKLVGAVTHVLVNDPTLGYGVLTGTMMEAAGAANKQSSASSPLMPVLSSEELRRQRDNMLAPTPKKLMYAKQLELLEAAEELLRIWADKRRETLVSGRI